MAVYVVVTESLTLMEEVVAPLLHLYVACPPTPAAVMVVLPPGQMLSFVILTVAVICGMILIFMVVESLQVAAYPYSVYVFVVSGFTQMLVAVLPVLHLYFVTPLPFSSTLSPAQIESLDGVIF